ncbi:unnamed protein product [[Actinomadura] parvosata subsp. kistnae]|nr:unnamed protein product [Actinomadura parvosata subsp. kistnae]
MWARNGSTLGGQAFTLRARSCCPAGGGRWLRCPWLAGRHDELGSREAAGQQGGQRVHHRLELGQLVLQFDSGLVGVDLDRHEAAGIGRVVQDVEVDHSWDSAAGLDQLGEQVASALQGGRGPP